MYHPRASTSLRTAYRCTPDRHTRPALPRLLGPPHAALSGRQRRPREGCRPRLALSGSELVTEQGRHTLQDQQHRLEAHGKEQAGWKTARRRGKGSGAGRGGGGQRTHSLSGARLFRKWSFCIAQQSCTVSRYPRREREPPRAASRAPSRPPSSFLAHALDHSSGEPAAQHSSTARARITPCRWHTRTPRWPARSVALVALGEGERRLTMAAAPADAAVTAPRAIAKLPEHVVNRIAAGEVRSILLVSPSPPPHLATHSAGSLALTPPADHPAPVQRAQGAHRERARCRRNQHPHHGQGRRPQAPPDPGQRQRHQGASLLSLHFSDSSLHHGRTLTRLTPPRPAERRPADPLRAIHHVQDQGVRGPVVARHLRLSRRGAREYQPRRAPHRDDQDSRRDVRLEVRRPFLSPSPTSSSQKLILPCRAAYADGEMVPVKSGSKDSTPVPCAGNDGTVLAVRDLPPLLALARERRAHTSPLSAGRGPLLQHAAASQSSSVRRRRVRAHPPGRHRLLDPQRRRRPVVQEGVRRLVERDGRRQHHRRCQHARQYRRDVRRAGQARARRGDGRQRRAEGQAQGVVQRHQLPGQEGPLLVLHQQ